MTLRINEQDSPTIFFFIKDGKLQYQFICSRKCYLYVTAGKKKKVNSESNKVVKNHGIIALQRHLRAIWFSLFILKMRKLSHHDMSSISYLGGNMEQNSSFLM